jgi:hypothetical protein
MSCNARPFAATLLLVGVAVLGGCATVTTVDASTDTSAPAIEPATDGFESLRALAAEGSVAATDLRPAADPDEAWVALDGELAPDAFTLVTAPSTSVAGVTATRTADLDTAHWSITDAGDVVMHAVDSHPDRTTSLFDPPLLLAPASLAAGEERSTSVAMRAVYTATPKKERDRGTARRTVRYARDEEIRWRGATHRAKVVTVHFEGDLGSAKATRESELWVIPEVGVVAERWKETLVILKVFTKRSHQFAYRR